MDSNKQPPNFEEIKTYISEGIIQKLSSLNYSERKELLSKQESHVLKVICNGMAIPAEYYEMCAHARDVLQERGETL